MGFWGIEIKPGKKVDPYEGYDAPGRLRITQATLGDGSSTERSVLQCYYGEHKGAVNLCSLLPDKTESSLLDLEIEEDDGLDFSVSGSRSIHLCGYFLPEEDVEDGDDADYGSSDEDAAPMCCSDSDCSEFDSEGDYDVVDSDESDLDMYSPKKSGVVIEEITDDQDAAKTNSKPKLLKNKPSKSEKNPELQQEVVARSNSGPVLESEDEDGFPTSNSQKSDQGVNQKKDSKVNSKNKKREMKTMELDDESDRQTKKKKKQKKMDKEENGHKEASNGREPVVDTEHKPKEVTKPKEVATDSAKPSASEPSNNAPSENDAEKKKKKKKNKKKKSEESKEGDQPVSTVVSEDDKKTESKASQVRTFPNGMIVEEIQMGKPDGKKAALGKQVAVHYIGKLKKNGSIFDSNVGRAPFKFRLGVGQVIKGWDVGVNGMRVGDKRRLTLPPSMGYGAKGAGGKIPPNAWLMFDVELVDVR